jgi:murein DD-endopeptidase MepM/ murein hydrolase activator NlpD
MFRNLKFYMFSSRSLDFREVRFFKTKMFGSGIAIGVSVLVLLVLINNFAGDVLGLGLARISVLSSENRLLRQQIRDLSDRMSGVQRSLERLYVRGNELRLLADLSAIDEDTRKAAVGGTRHAAANAFLTGEAGAVLDEAQGFLENLTREVRLQQASYEEIARRLEYNRELFRHMPAIKPMGGHYSLNGFGMRMHPVLGVYRMHTGVDIINDVGMPVYASGDGVVKFAGKTMAGYGTVVEISHGYGFTSLYAHLSDTKVRAGQTVRRGELIAHCGRSGLVSGPHLHYEVRRNGAKQNPVDYFFDDVDAARYRIMLANAQ